MTDREKFEAAAVARGWDISLNERGMYVDPSTTAALAGWVWAHESAASAPAQPTIQELAAGAHYPQVSAWSCAAAPTQHAEAPGFSSGVSAQAPGLVAPSLTVGDVVLPRLPRPYQFAVTATAKNTPAVRAGFEEPGYEKSPDLYTADQMRDYARAALAPAADAVQAGTLTRFDAVQRALDLASLMGGSIGQNDRGSTEAYRAQLREHLLEYITDAAQAEPYGYAYTVNGVHHRFERGAEPPPDDAYDAGSLVPLYTHAQPAAQAEPVAVGEMAALTEVAEFLNGDMPLEGVWFGDPHPEKRGSFWWRTNLRESVQALATKLRSNPPAQGIVNAGETGVKEA